MVLDSCDIDSGASIDSEPNGIPDECECFTLSGAPESVAETKNRFLSFIAGDPGRLQAVRVTLVVLPAPFDSWNEAALWVGPPRQVSEAGAFHRRYDTMLADMPTTVLVSSTGDADLLA